MRADRDEVDAWVRRWSISAATGEQLQALVVAQGAVPPMTGMSAEVVAELQVLPLRALGQLRDLFLPDLYPGGQRGGGSAGASRTVSE